MLCVMVLAGGACTTRNVAQVDPEAREAIGYAATARYTEGGVQRSDRAQVAAVDYPKLKELEILNLRETALTSPTLWVNGAYVRRLPTIAPKGAAKVKYGALLQAGQPGVDFAAADQPVTKVELQTDQGMVTVQGPAIKR
jgi:hypothetical protein